MNGPAIRWAASQQLVFLGALILVEDAVRTACENREDYDQKNECFHWVAPPIHCIMQSFAAFSVMSNVMRPKRTGWQCPWGDRRQPVGRLLGVCRQPTMNRSSLC